MTTTTVKDPNTYTLTSPLQRGNQTITDVTLRRPLAGELRGTKLTAIVDLDIDSMAKVFPRITTPMLTEQDVYRLDPADILQLGGLFNAFFLPKEQPANTESPTE
ncbi:phage tail assembly protein [Pseudoduganella sp. FT55W]|uniref:Phage tail assembly protein n=1 Tax=Duganella rivi TaxID=2666083 RepID=A0A7X4GXV6_9BURK|nr:phage tail assembly protein [Duganella rivi]MYM70544.1 phage tail assembly protein [Duganella rivi]